MQIALALMVIAPRHRHGGKNRSGIPCRTPLFSYVPWLVSILWVNIHVFAFFIFTYYTFPS
jgi:hypothetical protein